jgi:hypothetical protein
MKRLKSVPEFQKSSSILPVYFENSRISKTEKRARNFLKT